VSPGAAGRGLYPTPLSSLGTAPCIDANAAMTVSAPSIRTATRTPGGPSLRPGPSLKAVGNAAPLPAIAFRTPRHRLMPELAV
jgi:hypothetical protein